MDIYLIRHTTPDIENGIVYGRLDVGVREPFLREAEKVLEKLPAQFDRVYSSPLSRCLKLAELLPGDTVTDERLMELNFGEWEGKKWDDIHEKTLSDWMADYLNISPPGGETMLALQKRTLHFWSELKRRETGTVAVVTHGGVMRTLLAHLKQMPLKSVFDMEIPFGTVLSFCQVNSVLDKSLFPALRTTYHKTHG